MGLGALVLGIGLMVVLHFLPGMDTSAVEDTISEYAFSQYKWVFDGAVLLVAAASAAIFGALVRDRVLGPSSLGTLLGALWIASLVTVVVFEKTNWDIGPSIGGTIHRLASIVAFVALPLAGLCASRALYRDSSGWRRTGVALSVTSLLWFGFILGAVARMMAGGPPWWRSIPLGLVERGMALNEMLILVLLAVGLCLRTPPRAASRAAAA